MSAELPSEAHEFRSFPRVLLLSCVFGMVAIGTDMYLPAMPAMGAAFGVDAQDIQLSLSVFIASNACGQLLFGPISDRFGRRPVLLVGIVVYGVTSFICAMTAELSTFLAARALQGLSGASGPVLVRAMINDRLSKIDAAKTLALLTGLMAFIAMLTPILAGFMVRFGSWEIVFYFMSGLALALALSCLTALKETLPPRLRVAKLDLPGLLEVYGTILRTPQFWVYTTTPGLLFAGVFAYVGTNSYLLIEHVGLEESRHGVTYAVAAFAYVLGSFTSHRIVEKLGIDQTIVVGLGMNIVGALLAAAASSALELSLWLIVVPGVVAFYTTAIVVPVAVSRAVGIFPRSGGSASALAGFIQLLISGAGTVVE